MYTASTWRRIVAYWFDKIIMIIFFAPIGLQAWVSWWKTQTFELSFNLLILCFLVHFAFRVAFLSQLGGTVGKLLTGLRVVDRHSGQFPSVIQSVIRTSTDELSLILGDGFRLLVFFRFDRTHLSDWLAETQVKQFSPRVYPPRPHPIWALILCLYLSIEGFMTAYSLVQRSDCSFGQIVIYPNSIQRAGR